MLGAGLVAKKAAALGAKVKPWVKTSLAPGSLVVTEYLENGQKVAQYSLCDGGYNKSYKKWYSASKIRTPLSLNATLRPCSRPFK